MVNVNLVTSLIIFIFSAVVLTKSGTLIVRSLVRIAKVLRMKEFVIGFILMAFFTSMPELFVGITSAIKGTPALALGTAIGSNIANLTLIIGLAILVGKGIKVSSESIKHNMLYMIAIASVPIILMMFGNGLSRVDALILLGIYALYTRKLFKESWLYTDVIDEDQRKQLNENSKNQKALRIASVFFNNFIVFSVSLALLFGSAWALTTSAKNLSIELGFPEILVGLLVIAIGTSLPELTFQVKSILAKHQNMALGNLVGSIINNSTLVLGVTALISPIQAEIIPFVTSAFFMLVVAFLFMALVNSKGGIDWREAMALIILYLFFVIVELGIRPIYSNGIT